MVALAPNTSETSSWDVLETFPKLHSRAREVKTRICTEAPHSKSLDCVEIWQVIYDCRVGLESFTRDPIGFRGSEWNLYRCYFGLLFTDPSGLDVACKGLEHLQGLSVITSPTLAGIPGMGWSRENIPDTATDIVLGRTSTGFKINCGCVECCKKWYFGSIDIDLTFRIYIDYEKHVRLGFPLEYVDGNTSSIEGTYGHEQRHVFAGVTMANALAANTNIDFGQSFGEGAYGKFVCERECNALKEQLKDTFKIAIQEEMSHGPGIRAGTPYPPLGNMPNR